MQKLLSITTMKYHKKNFVQGFNIIYKQLFKKEALLTH